MRPLALLLAICVLCATSAAWAHEQPRVKLVEVHSEGLFLMVDFEVEGAFTQKVDEGILSGLPTTFTFQVHMARERSGWTDERIATIEVRRTISYDTLRQEYTVDPSSQGQAAVTKDFQAAHDLMSTIRDIPLVIHSVLEPDQRYYVEVKAELRSVELPPFLDSLLFFVTFWDLETEWTRVYIDQSLWSDR
ncbi:MAG: DUF4390 domain-containing protein [Candidatus Alcyoniella australis]|nr:DUF4390 domain-containing protein [Candidatus Alcyoniella australis]